MTHPERYPAVRASLLGAEESIHITPRWNIDVSYTDNLNAEASNLQLIFL